MDKGRKTYARPKSDPRKTLAIKRRKYKNPFPDQSAGAHCLKPVTTQGRILTH